MKNIWLLGDSIRLSYQPLVKANLKNKANIKGPSDNCRYSLYTLSSFESWLEELGTPDIIHWNNGLWDVGHDSLRAPEQFSITDYVKNLEFLIQKFKALDSKIIWASTTPVKTYKPADKEQWKWYNSEIAAYNNAAKTLMNNYSIPINDLHTLVNSDVNKYICEDRLHLSKAGIRLCADAVTKLILKFI
ncbi:MAG: SGNH/GDSL hydrolase family protein [Ignavibacteriae bacterium]|nr:SGNH/GDSL hydrolase family protein [Ignavibacteriota bacterium]NOG97756.1 SGNH/GDSL hydrolase family protein [Ignavibacteriota bacterium]